MKMNLKIITMKIIYKNQAQIYATLVIKGTTTVLTW